MGKIKEAMAIGITTHNILASGTQIKGDISAEEDFRVDGSIEGNIVCKGKIIVGTSSTITGEIRCVNIELLGQVNGNIFCSESVILRAPSFLNGDIKTKIIEIEPGAKFEGSCSMYINE